MALIDLIEISKKFGEKVVLQDINLSINQGERVAIIGKNGEGKSTLMKIILGNLEADFGRVVRQNLLNISMLNQTPNFNANLSVKDALKLELKDIFDARDEYEKILDQIAKNHENSAILQRQNELIKFLDAKDGWQIENKIDRVLKHFNLEIFENRTINSLSGGEIRRVGLGALILKKPDVLLLDEPTNHLDVYMTKFLEDMLLSSRQTIIFISHDRYFIDKIATRLIEVESGNVRNFDGGYGYYLQKKQEILASLQKTHETLIKLLKSEEEWLRRGVKARLKRNEGRKERIFAMREEAKKNPGILRRAKIELQRAGALQNQINDKNRQKMIFEIKNLNKSINGKTLFENFNARVLQREKIAIVGPNGSGKSTLLKILQGEISQDSGEIKRGDLKIGYFDQSRNFLDDDKSLIETFCPNGGDHIWVKGHFMHVYGYMKSFLFPKEFLDKKIGVLSGGEKNRVGLALLFSKDYDVLILDEPTNDLDISTINILEEYLLNFKGAVLLVGHDRYFVDKIATKLWAYENGKIEISNLSYSEFLEVESEIYEIDEIEKNLNQTQNQKVKISKKLSYKQQEILDNHPQKIEILEKKIKELNSSLSDPKIYNEIGIDKLYAELEDNKKELEKMENEYFEILEIYDNLN